MRNKFESYRSKCNSSIMFVKIYVDNWVHTALREKGKEFTECR